MYQFEITGAIFVVAISSPVSQSLAMPSRASRREFVEDMEETVKLAARIVSEATGQPSILPAKKAKNPAAVALGKLGASKGGQARAASLSKAERVEIARKAAIMRWKKQD